MHIALISMEGGSADVRLAGRTIAWHQVHCALAIGCERIVCIAHAPSSDLGTAQRAAESQGKTFHAMPHHRALAGLVSAGDIVTVLAPGVLPDREWVRTASSTHAGVAAFPADEAVGLGFERIDRDRAWAGVLTVRGDAIEMLSSLPPDADPVAALLRIALQRGAPIHPLSPDWLEQGQWALLRTQADAARHEQRWYAREVPPPSWHHPVERIAYQVARAMLARGVDADRTLSVSAAASAALGVGAGAAGWLGYTTGGMLSLAIAGSTSAMALAASRFGKAGIGRAPAGWQNEFRRSSLDLALLATAMSPAVFGGWQAVFAAAVLSAAMRLADEVDAPAIIRPFADRTLMFATLAGFAAVDRFAGGAAFVALAALGLRVFWPRKRG